MKKIAFSFALMLCWVAALAQPDFSALKFGMRSSIGLGSVSIKQDDDNTFQSGFQYSVGAYAEMPVWRRVNLVAEIDFEHTGVHDKSSSMHVETIGGYSAQILSHTEIKYPLNYLRIPILARANILNNVLYVEAGPQLGFLVGKVETWEKSKVTTIVMGGSNTADNEGTTDSTDSFAKGHLAFDFGWGFNLGQISLGFRTCLGMTDLMPKKYKEEHGLQDMRTGFTSLQIGMRYTF